MALRKTFQTSMGLDVDCYIRVDSVHMSKQRGYSIHIAYYAFNAEGEQAQFDSVHLDNFHFPFELEPTPQVPNVLARAYELLKTLPEFADAIDV